jgi:hypothetical protein
MDSNIGVINEEWIRKKLNINHENLGNFYEYLYNLQIKQDIQNGFKFKRGYKSDLFTGNISRKSNQIGQFIAQVYASQRVGLVTKCADQFGRN